MTLDWTHAFLGALVASGAAWLVVRALRVEVSAWTGFAAITYPETAIRLAQRAGVTRLALFVNSEPEPGRAFYTYDRGAIARACAKFRAAGLDVTIVTWVTPRPDWIAGMATVGQIATENDADEIEFDVEEEMTQGLKDASDATIADTWRRIFEQARSTFRGSVVVDHIVFTDLRIVGPAIALADASIPQAYATKKNAGTRPPGELERIAVDRFRPFRKPLIMGVAGWNQEGAYGMGYLDAMRTSLTTATSLGIRRVRVWRLEQIDEQEARELVAWRARRLDREAA